MGQLLGLLRDQVVVAYEPSSWGYESTLGRKNARLFTDFLHLRKPTPSSFGLEVTHRCLQSSLLRKTREEVVIPEEVFARSTTVVYEKGTGMLPLFNEITSTIGLHSNFGHEAVDSESVILG